MYNAFPALFSPRVKMLILAALFPAVSAGCGGAQYAAAPDIPRVDDSAAYASCLAFCSENTSLALVTRTGCLEGCEEARRTFTLSGRTFSSHSACLDAFARQNLARADRIRELRAWCDARWTHVHNRKGCYRGVDAFYAALDPAFMCGSDDSGVADYEASMDSHREETAMPFPPAAADQPPLTPAGPVQPAGPFLPPPYVPEQPLENPPYGSPRASAPLPAETQPVLRDTPKYQKIPSAKSVNSTQKTGTPAPVENATPFAASRPETAKAPAAPAQPSAMPAVPTIAPVPTDLRPALAEPTQPLPPPVPPSEPAGPASDVPPPPSGIAAPDSESPAVPAPATPPVLLETPAITAPTELPAPSLDPVIPTEPDTHPTPTPALPENTYPVETPELSDTAQTPTRQGPPIPGLNANRSVPPAPEPSQQTSPALLPPVPSMLNRPYNTPAIIAPQIDIPEEGNGDH